MLLGVGRFAPGAAVPAGVTLTPGDGFALATRACAAAPTPSEAALREHDAAVRAAAEAAEAFLPARFGQTFAHPAAAAAAAAADAAALTRALDAVRGAAQMTLRWFGTASAPAAATPPPEGGPGTRYLAARRAALAAASGVPELEPELGALRPLTRAETIRRGTPPVLASVYHLVAVERLADYRATLDATPAAPGLRRVASGPSPCYAFAPGLPR